MRDEAQAEYATTICDLPQEERLREQGSGHLPKEC